MSAETPVSIHHTPNLNPKSGPKTLNLTLQTRSQKCNNKTHKKSLKPTVVGMSYTVIRHTTAALPPLTRSGGLASFLKLGFHEGLERIGCVRGVEGDAALNFPPVHHSEAPSVGYAVPAEFHKASLRSYNSTRNPQRLGIRPISFSRFSFAAWPQAYVLYDL